MKLESYIKNPSGKSSVYSHHELYRDLYTNKLDVILLRETGNIKYFLYVIKDTFMIHLKMPSEKVPNFYYDVVLEFSTKDPITKADTTVKNYDFKAFSNDPSFIYTFAHAFKEQNMVIDMLKPKVGKQPLKEKAKEKNPKDEIGYVKSIYFAYLIMKQRNLFYKSMFKTYQTYYNEKDFISGIMEADTKIELRRLAEEDMNAEAKKEKYKEQQKKQSASNSKPREVISNKPKTAKPTVSIVGKMKKVAPKSHYITILKRK